MKTVATMAAVLLALGAIAWAFISYERAEAVRFEATAEVSSGTIMEKWQVFAESRRRPTRNRYVLAYRFKTTTGAVVDGTDSIDPKTWNRLKRGDDIRVYYLPDAPRINHLRLQSAVLNDLNWAQIVIVLCVVSVLAAGIILLLRRA